MKQQYVNEISHRRFCRMDKNYMSTVRGSGAGYCGTDCSKTKEDVPTWCKQFYYDIVS